MISPGAHDCEFSRDCSAVVAPMVSLQPFETPSVSDRASCEDYIITAIPRGPTVAKSAVQPDRRPAVTVLLSAGQTAADPKTVADLFAEHFASVSRKDPAAPGARYRQSMESLGVNLSSTGGESYNVPFSVSELQTALSQCHDSSPGPDDIPYAFLHHMSDSAFTFFIKSL
ncbi:hypothetical protein E2C01_036913 [Portunus trituberculatus]|uniref:Uncharacterized protein n=1 Tax=Portunus trituberculatus TaxID=210409 RepID=A0A5B7F6R1_PORTR|nr:hypothetical protein [Portunus trituberculatus]